MFLSSRSNYRVLLPCNVVDASFKVIDKGIQTRNGDIGTSHLLLDANIQQQRDHKYNEQQQTMITSKGFIKVLVTRGLSKRVTMYSSTLSKGNI